MRQNRGEIEVKMGCWNLLSGLNSNHRLETTVFNLAWNFLSRLKFSIPSFRIPTKIEVWWVARLKLSISHEKLQDLEFFSIFGPLGTLCDTFFENNATLYRTEKRCRPQNRPKIGERVTKNSILALFGFSVSLKMIEKLGVCRGPASSQHFLACVPSVMNSS